MHAMPSARARVFLAEEFGSVAQPLISRLEEEGHEVKWVQSMRECRAQLEDYGPDILVLSTMLETDGLEFFQALRFAPHCPPGGVIIITDVNDVRARERALQLGAAAVFSKPVDPNELRLAVEDLLAFI
jgi:DNA-binding response OmpR family regulator